MSGGQLDTLNFVNSNIEAYNKRNHQKNLMLSGLKSIENIRIIFAFLIMKVKLFGYLTECMTG